MSANVPSCAWASIEFYYIDDTADVVATVKASGATKFREVIEVPPAPDMLGYTFRPMTRDEIIAYREEEAAEEDAE